MPKSGRAKRAGPKERPYHSRLPLEKLQSIEKQLPPDILEIARQAGNYPQFHERLLRIVSSPGDVQAHRTAAQRLLEEFSATPTGERRETATERQPIAEARTENLSLDEVVRQIGQLTREEQRKYRYLLTVLERQGFWSAGIERRCGFSDSAAAGRAQANLMQWGFLERSTRMQTTTLYTADGTVKDRKTVPVKSFTVAKSRILKTLQKLSS